MTSAILILRNNQQTGPFPEEQVRQMLADGRAAATDLAWRQGMAEWKPLSEVISAPSAVPMAAVAAAGGGSAAKWGLAAGIGALVIALGGVGAWQYSQQQKLAAEQQRLAQEQQRIADEQARAEEQRQQEEKKKAEEEMQRLAEEKRQAEEKNKELEQRLADEKRAAERERQRERQYQTRQRTVSDTEFVSRNSMNSPYGTNPPPPPICRECGVIQSIRPITREGQGSGLGAVAGGVVGGALGNQVGRGRGRDAATVVGVIGGAVVGNQIEKSQRTTTSYEITVRFDDGSVRVFNQEAQPYWRQGDRVRVYNGQLSGY